MIRKFIKKPIVVEAVQWTVDNYDEILEFCRNQNVKKLPYFNQISIDTIKGDMTLEVGDWIIKDGKIGLYKSGLYPCSRDIFESTYDLYEDEA